MNVGNRPVGALDGGFDLQATLECGQSYLWRRADGHMYEEPNAAGGDAWYHVALPSTATETDEPEVIRLRQVDELLEWEASTPNAYARIEELLRLDDDLEAILAATPDDPLIERAYEAYRGLRLVRDPPFASLVSFICSAQMRVGRIHEMQVSLAERYGESVAFDGETYRAFPTAERLAAASEADLRELSLGYRAPYVERTAEMVADGEAHPGEARDLAYEAARESLTRFVGVGRKVADCVLLFSLGHLQAVPLDTWIRTAIEEHYPDCERDNYEETSRAIRERFGGEYAGYAQTYVFNWLRNNG
ncbi:8-oxoguanine DNA glycosylase [Halobacteriales archaeon QS_4_69_225]|nr:MAG: 8-oxoguanine DNA glycosylase [Halobacteriales archaeon QS_4_69_225]